MVVEVQTAAGLLPPEVPETPVGSDLLQPLQVLSQLVVQTVGQHLQQTHETSEKKHTHRTDDPQHTRVSNVYLKRKSLTISFTSMEDHTNMCPSDLLRWILQCCWLVFIVSIQLSGPRTPLIPSDCKCFHLIYSLK